MADWWFIYFILQSFLPKNMADWWFIYFTLQSFHPEQKQDE